MSFEAMLVDALAPEVAKKIDLMAIEGLKKYIRKIVKSYTPALIIKLDNSEQQIRIEKCHHKFEEVLSHLQTLEPVFLTGPAGSGKSTIAEHAAKAMNYNFASISVCAQTTKSDFLGYTDANGQYVGTLFRRIYEDGGIFLIDEIDAGNPNVLAVLNAALSGIQYAFPDKLVQKNEKFLLVATANTLGKGSTEYIGRNQLDAATLDRFNLIHIDYDQNLERMLFPDKYNRIIDKLHKLRLFILQKNLKIIVSTRSIIKIIKLLESNYSYHSALKATIFKSTEDDLAENIIRSVGD